MKTTFKYLLLAFLLVMIALVGSSCNSYKKQLGKFKLFAASYPAERDKLCAENYKSDTTYIKGTEIIKHDTAVVAGPSLPCPPAEPGKTVYVKCPDGKIITIYKDRVDTVQTDKPATVAKIYDLTNVLKINSDSLVIVKTQLSESKQKQKKLTLYLIGAVILIGGGIALKIAKFI